MVFKVEEVSVCVCLLEEKSLDGDVYICLIRDRLLVEWRLYL